MDDIKKLIENAQNGDRESFGQIYKYFYAKIYRYCEFNIENKELAQDLCQETFVKAWKNIKNFNFKNENWSMQAFLFKIARNLIIDHSRKKKVINLTYIENIESNEDLIEEFDKKTEIEKVAIALKRLDEEDRQIIIFRFFEEMDTKEIAGILDKNDGAIRVRLHRIMQKLKIILENHDRRTN